MGHLDLQPEDNCDVEKAKQYISGEINVGALESRSLLVSVLDDRSNWIAKISEVRDTLIDAVGQFTPGNETERELLSLMARQLREVSAMLSPQKGNKCE